MARPSRCRRICGEPVYEGFAPTGTCVTEKVNLAVDEYEVIRLIDLEKMTHEQCAMQMCISRTTVTEIYETAREKIADSIVNGKRLCIAGGNYRLCDGSGICWRRNSCQKQINQKGDIKMRIAVTYENGEVFQHFGHTSQFKLYDIEGGSVVREQVADTNGQGHGALSGFLAEAGVDALICGGIGGGAQTALADAGIRLFGGVSGRADDAVKAYLAGNLGFNPDVQCNHHSHEHSCGGHSCHEDKHDCAGNG